MRLKSRALVRYAIFIIALYIVMLAATAPATLLARMLPPQSGLQLGYLSGTLWQGTVDKASFPSALGQVQVRDIRWELQWSYLLRGELALKLESAEAVGNIIVARSWRTLRIAQADLALPAAELAQILPALMHWEPEGEVQLQTRSFALQSNSEAMLTWRNAALNLSSLQPLGDYRLNIRYTAEKMELQLETQQGDLKLAGQGSYSAQAGLKFQGTAQTDAAHAADLKKLLEVIGQNRGDGVHAFSLALR